MSTYDPVISVVMSVYNSGKYLAEAIDSILSQTFTDFEFIIINDGSTDGSLSIIKGYRENDDRIVLISRKNKGLPFSLNEGIAASRGKYIARMDSDDIALPQRLQKQYDFMEKYNEVGVLGSGALTIDEKGQPLKRGFIPKKVFISYSDLDIRANLLFSSALIHPTVLIRKSVLDRSGCVYNVKAYAAQDYDLWCRLSSFTMFANLRECLIMYRVNTESLSAKIDTNKKNEIVENILNGYLVDFDYFDPGLHLSIARLNAPSVKAFSKIKRYERLLKKYSENKWSRFYTFSNSIRLFLFYRKNYKSKVRVCFEGFRLLFLFVRGRCINAVLRH